MAESLLIRCCTSMLTGRKVITLGFHVTKALNQRALPLSAIRDRRTGPR
ncbi:hypothetical protein [Kocuria rosea]|nr:hypothetical protein [Kocuria rosea]WIG15947.1 hypothetical protein QOY29_09500 [Kocuria rosea]